MDDQADAPSSARCRTRMAEFGEAEEPDRDEPGRRRRNLPDKIRASPITRCFSTKFDEEVGAEELVRSPRSLTGCGPTSTSSSASSIRVVGRLANRLQRRLLAQQNRSWEFDLEEGQLDPVAAYPRRSSTSMRGHLLAAQSFKWEKDTELPRYGGDAADRQFRLDARASDHGGGDLCRHSGADA